MTFKEFIYKRYPHLNYEGENPVVEFLLEDIIKLQQEFEQNCIKHDVSNSANTELSTNKILTMENETTKSQLSAAIFHFTEKYRHINYTEQEATVKLEIDYRGKSFSITPSYGADSFKFCQTSKDYKMWQAVLVAINKAIEFANMEIGVTARPERAG